MIEQKDIDRLLAGREIVDAYRKVAGSYREAVELASKPEAVTADKVTKAERYSDREAATIKMNKELLDLGFSGSGEFIEFNEQMVIEEYTEMVTLTFSGCANCPTRKCVELYGQNACGNQSLEDIASIERSMRLFFLRLIKMSKDGKEKNFADVKVCPDGYGFQWQRNRDERFDLWWK
jgi:hypothetical protein